MTFEFVGHLNLSDISNLSQAKKQQTIPRTRQTNVGFADTKIGRPTNLSNDEINLNLIRTLAHNPLYYSVLQLMALWKRRMPC